MLPLLCLLLRCVIGLVHVASCYFFGSAACFGFVAGLFVAGACWGLLLLCGFFAVLLLLPVVGLLQFLCCAAVLLCVCATDFLLQVLTLC